MFFFKTRTRTIGIDVHDDTTPRHILNAFMTLTEFKLNANEFRIITMGQQVKGEDLDRTWRDLNWHKLATVHLVLSPEAEAALEALDFPDITPERASAGLRP